MKKRAAFLLVAVLATVALLIAWRHYRTQPTDTVATKPATEPAANLAATPAGATSASVAAAPTPASPSAVQRMAMSMPTAAPLPMPTPAAPPISAAQVQEPTAPTADPTPNSAAPAATIVAAPALPHIDEVTGTRRMILAHAPLRDPRVANPDSVENRQVLQSMVAKALARADKKP
jgi:hypothetical protein